MSTAPEDDPLLAGLLAGDLDPRDPAIAARLQRDPKLAERWAEIQALAADLDAEGRLRREVLAPPSAREIEATERMLRVARGGSRPARHGSGLRWLAAAAAIVLLLGAGYIGWRALRSPEPDRGRDFLLGTNPPWITSPEGVWTAGETLSWNLALPAGGRFRVAILDATTGRVLLERPPVEAPAWNVEPVEFRRLPESVDVRIEVLEPDGTLADVRSARLSVSH